MEIEKEEAPPEPAPNSAQWGRSRAVFLGVSGLFVAGVLWQSTDVLLPFVLALILAYVLTPLVALCERWGLGRALAIGVVYVTTLTTVYVTVALMAPRIYQETRGLVQASPGIARKLAAQWAPVVEANLEGILGSHREPESALGPPPAALEITPGPDGSLSVRMGAGVDIIREGPTHWRVLEHVADRTAFNLERFLGNGLEGAVEYLRANALQLLRVGQEIVSRVTRGIFLGIMTLMVAGYLMHTRDQITGFFRSLVPAGSRDSFDRLLWRMDRGLAGVVRGQLVICAVNGVLSAIGFALFGLEYWPVLALVACVLSIIPIFGSIVSTVPAVIIGLTQGVWTAVWVLLWIVGIHQLEANLLNPKIIGATARLHPVLVVFVLIAGEHFFGLWGALLAVPLLSLTQSVFNHFRAELMPESPPSVPRPGNV